MTPPILHAWLGHLIEVASVGLFGWVGLDLYRRRRQEHIELLIAALYGWLLETLDMRVFGTYHYGSVTWWWVGDVPVYIPLLWATIMHSSMALSDRAGLPVAVRPFLDGLLAVLIDLAIDAVAIRVGLWSWRIPLDAGWFGVPAGNLCAWMWVAAWYGGVTRLVRGRIDRRASPGWHRLLVPPVAYAGLFGCLFLIGASGWLLGLTDQNARLWIFAAHAAAFTAVVALARRSGGADGVRPHSIPASLTWNRWLMHGSFALVLALSGIWTLVPALVAVSAGAMGLERWAQRWCERAGR